MNNNWKTIASKIVYKNRIFEVHEDKVIRPNGEKSPFYIVSMNNSVMIVPLTSKNEVYLIGLYRYPTKMFSWEIPGGMMDDENPVENAKRELVEETGLISDDVTEIGTYQAMNGSVNKIGHIFVATNVVQTNRNKQKEDDITEMKKVPFIDAMKMVENGEITDSHTTVALTLTGLKLNLLSTYS